jgi:calcineurin-like phosphoesterase family protein
VAGRGDLDGGQRLTDVPGTRNLEMAQRISATPVRYPFSFVVAGDSGAWPDPTADAIFAALVQQTARLQPLFFANLGDFAGPGTIERHERYLRVVAPLAAPNVCLIGNHDLDDPSGRDAWAQVHGPTNFAFGYGHTRFIAIDAAPQGAEGPREDALAFLAHSLEASAEPHRVVLMHCPPHLDGHFAPHAEWGFEVREREFLSLIRRHDVELVCCAHALMFDQFVHDGARFVISGGGGTALCSHSRGVCTPGDGPPEDRGGLFHAVQIVVTEGGAISGRVLQAFDPADGHARITFGDVTGARSRSGA